MRSPFRVFHSFVLALFGTVAYKALLLAPDLARDPEFGVYAVPAVVVILWLLFSYSRTISDRLLEWLPLVRRVLAGRRHIEGDWPLVVADKKTGGIVYYGFLSIGFEDGQYAVKGQDWYPDGRHAMKFNSVQTYQDHPTLHYWYMQGENDQQRGYTFIEFFPSDEVPRRHTGVFHDKDHPNVRFYGRKLKYRWREPRLKDMEPRRLAAKTFADEIAPNLQKMVHTSVNADWG